MIPPLHAPCLACSVWGFGCLLVGLVVLLAMSKIALSFLTGLIEWFFGVIQLVVLGVVSTLAGLSPWAAVPLGLTLLLVLFWMVRGYAERRQWRGLERVREEFVPLQRLLRTRGLHTYLAQLDKVRLKLFAERDRVEAVQGLLDEELPRIEARLGELSELLGQAAQEDERAEFRALMRDLAGNSARLRARRGDLEQFARAQVRVASRLNLLRQRLTEVPAGSGDLQPILADLDSISLMEDLFHDGPATDPRLPEESASPPPAAPPRQEA